MFAQANLSASFNQMVLAEFRSQESQKQNIEIAAVRVVWCKIAFNFVRPVPHLHAHGVAGMASQ